MKTLSLSQPWASLIMLGAKRFETRSWKTKHRGLLAIHASSSYPKACRVLASQEPFAGVLGGAANRLPLAAVLGVMELVGCQTTEVFTARIPPKETWVHDWDRELAFGDYRPGRYVWELKLLNWFYKPVPMKGNPSLWECPEELLTEWSK